MLLVRFRNFDLRARFYPIGLFCPRLISMSEMTETKGALGDGSVDAPVKVLTPAAQRALAEAEARRQAYEKAARDAAQQKEIDGRGGLEPVRYGDWEIKGLTSDF